jgi:preprotein translocase SecE subunit
MARDRQRAKQRRRRSAGAGGPQSGNPRSRARADRERDQVEPEATRDQVEPEPTRDRVEPEPTGAPEPTEHAFPDVEQARMAEAGVPQHADFEEAEPDEDDLERAPDEVQPGSAYTDPAVEEERAEARRPRRKRGKILTFLGHVVDELRRVQWPDRRQTAQGTAVTLGFVVVAGGFLGLMDAIWKPLVEAIL